MILNVVTDKENFELDCKDYDMSPSDFVTFELNSGKVKWIRKSDIRHMTLVPEKKVEESPLQ